MAANREGLPISDPASASASWRTLLAIHQRSGATVEHHREHLVVRTPANPGFHWGNCLLVTGDPADPGRWLKRFAAEFPDAGHRAIGLLNAPVTDAWQQAGLELETERTLTSETPVAPTPTPQGYFVAPLEGPDWDLLVAANCAPRPDDDGHREFVQRRVAGQQRLTEGGGAAWFAASDATGVVASLGIVVVGDDARYQAVLTAPEHRRRGLARHLLGVASAWAFDRGARQLVIVADEGEDGDRLYRQAGFVPGALECSAYAPVWPKPDAAD